MSKKSRKIRKRKVKLPKSKIKTEDLQKKSQRRKVRTCSYKKLLVGADDPRKVPTEFTRCEKLGLTKKIIPDDKTSYMVDISIEPNKFYCINCSKLPLCQ